jgi:hypothetical protein
MRNSLSLLSSRALVVSALALAACSVEAGRLTALDDGASGGGAPADPAATGSGDATGSAAGDGTGGGAGSGTGAGTGGGTGGSTDGGAIGDGPASTLSASEKLFRALEPRLTQTCGGTNGSCHVNGSFNQSPVWLATPDAYASIKKYPGIVVKDPQSSRLILKGAHAGPAFTGPNAALGDSVLQWLTSEAASIVATPQPGTDASAVVVGPNTLDISKGGTNVTGAKLAFTATVSGSILTLTKLTVTAPAAGAMHVVHPMFVTVPSTGSALPDPVDSFSNLDQTVPAGATAALGVGTLILSNWAAGAKLLVQFTTLASTTVPDGGTVGGCRSVATFTTNAVPAIQNNTCLNCHGAPGGSGFAALDLSQVGKDNAKACAQALNRVNLASKAQSTLLTAPTGGIAAHPYKNAPATYTQMMTLWLNNE